ncbi:hypothetical protein [Patulibacter defluvii]|uniref:hypothetical protein n=1 Tax=Patulibacter defluvii TaxID=3095358 RepID=UPI002A759BFB|nr:hypothetical protein [Patulibacter sp. DM4]
MARTTKRKTKHRGNAAGMIETRGGTGGRSGGPPSRNGKGPRDGKRVDPRLREPTWRSAFIRALVAAAIFVVVMLALKGSVAGVAVTGVVLLGLYTPFGYYTDRFFYRRRMAKLGQQVRAKK